MKKIIILAILALASFAAHAQSTNTKAAKGLQISPTSYTILNAPSLTLPGTFTATAGFTSVQTNALAFAWTNIPPSTSTTTNWWIGTFTNGQLCAIATNPAAGGYIIKQIAP